MSDSTNERPSRVLRLLMILAAIAVVLLIPVVVFLVNNRPPHISGYSPPMPKPNGWDDFVAAGRMVDHTHYGPYSMPNKTLSSWTIPEYEVFVRGNAAAVARLRLGLTMPSMCPPIRSSRDFSRCSGNFAIFREMNRVLRGEARYYRAIGKPGEAARTLLDGAEFGVSLARGGGSYPAAVGAALESMCVADLPDLLPELTESDLARTATRIEHIQMKRTPYSDIVTESGRVSTAMWSEFLSDPKQMRQWASPTSWISGYNWTAVGQSGSYRALTNARFALANKQSMLQANEAYYHAVAKEQRRPYDGRCRMSAPRNLLARSGKSIVECRAILTTNEAKLALVHTAIALRRYNMARGVYPARMSDLSPVYLSNGPVDPFGQGKALKYKVVGNGKSFLLYSIGPNLRDDGGKLGLTDGDLVYGKT